MNPSLDLFTDALFVMDMIMIVIVFMDWVSHFYTFIIVSLDVTF